MHSLSIEIAHPVSCKASSSFISCLLSLIGTSYHITSIDTLIFIDVFQACHFTSICYTLHMHLSPVEHISSRTDIACFPLPGMSVTWPFCAIYSTTVHRRPRLRTTLPCSPASFPAIHSLNT